MRAEPMRGLGYEPVVRALLRRRVFEFDLVPASIRTGEHGLAVEDPVVAAKPGDHDPAPAALVIGDPFAVPRRVRVHARGVVTVGGRHIDHQPSLAVRRDQLLAGTRRIGRQQRPPGRDRGRDPSRGISFPSHARSPGSESGQARTAWLARQPVAPRACRLRSRRPFGVGAGWPPDRPMD